MTLKPGLSYRFFHVLWSGLDLFFPPVCAGCGRLGARWCPECQQSLERVPLPVCDICGRPQTVTGLCKQCESTRPAFYALRSCAVFKDQARAAIHKLKYRSDLGLGEALAWHVAVFLEELHWQADSLLPIPLSEQRFAERGYNQVDLIAHPLARLTGYRYLPRALRRVRHTRSQVGLAYRDRQNNVVGAFTAQAPEVKGKTLLLIDDVATTGATLNAASASLLEAGASRIYALTFAKALPKYGFDQPNSFSTRSLR